MKSIPLVAFLLAALCTVGAITAYVLVGRTEAEEPFRASLRRTAAGDAAVISEVTHITSGTVVSQVDSEPRRSVPQDPSVQVQRVNATRSVVTPFVSVPLPESTPNWTETAPTPAHAFATPRVDSSPRVIDPQSTRTSSSPISSKPSVSRAAVQPLRAESSNQPAPAPAKDGEKSRDPTLLAPPDSATPESSSHFHRNSVPVKQRPAWPRGNFTIEQERLRAQIGWQAFADQIFENSVNPPQDELAE